MRRSQSERDPGVRLLRAARRRRPARRRPAPLPAALAAGRRAAGGAGPRGQGRGAARAADGRRPARAPPARPAGGAHDRPARDRRDRDGGRAGALDHEPVRPHAQDEAARGGGRGRRDRRDEGDVLQPAVARAQVPPRDAAAAPGQVPGPQPLPRLLPRPDGRGGWRRGGDGDLSGHRGALVDADPRAGARVAQRQPGRARAAARPAARARAPARPRRGARRRALRRSRGRAPPARVRGADAAPDRAVAPARAPAGGRARQGARAAGRAHPAVAGGLAAVHAHDGPMQRLLMGEVGSGKTVVALYAMLRAVEQGAQAALMAPTETLAEQHFATLQTLMPGELLQAALLTGSTSAGRRADLLGKLASGELKLLVGTHALIEGAVEFDRLAVAVVDEQHRFGVRQRRALDRKGPGARSPHVLHMTATPIPRTLALTAYGDLDVTVLRELPAGRRPIDTFVASSERERARAYERIREELRAGRQAFVVCPLVEESEALQARAATAEFERLQATELRDFRVVLLHGQKRPREKQEAMAAFAGGGADVLVATTVIEVGIDVPNASVMLVENAERYGISQLHQLRGRIGRGEHASVCVLFGPKESPRLRALAEHGDGFKLAEIDLELRGEGEMLGTRQSGLAQFKIARLPEDAELLERARMRARTVLDADPELRRPEHVLLEDAVHAAYGAEALEPIPA